MSGVRIATAIACVALVLVGALLVLDAERHGHDDPRLVAPDLGGDASPGMTLDAPAGPLATPDAAASRTSDLLAPLRDSEPEPLALSTIELSGVVLDELGAPIPGARRVALSWTGLPGKVLDLDADGGFTLSVPRDRETRVHVSALGHLDCNASFVPPQDEPSARVELRLRRTGRVEGRVLFSGAFVAPGVPVRIEAGTLPDVPRLRPGALVFASTAPLALTTKSDGAGRFAFELPPVACLVTPNPRGAPAGRDTRDAVVRRWDDPAAPRAPDPGAVVVVPAVGSILGCDLFVPTQPGLEGRVLADRAGVPGVTLELMRTDGESYGDIQRSVTRADGGFVFERVDPGRYRLATIVPGTARVRDVVALEVVDGRREWVELDVSGVRVVLDAVDARDGARVRPVLFDLVPVGAIDPHVRLDRFVLADDSVDDGVLDPLPPGTYRVSAVELDGDAAQSARFAIAPSAAVSRPVTVEEPDTATLVGLMASSPGRRAPAGLVEVFADPGHGIQRIVLELR